MYENYYSSSVTALIFCVPCRKPLTEYILYIYRVKKFNEEKIENEMIETAMRNMEDQIQPRGEHVIMCAY